MRIDRSRQRKPWIIPAGSLIFAFVFQLAATSAAAQTSLSKISSLRAARSGRTNTLKANFSHSPRYPVVGQSVRFTDASLGNPVSWQWDFGDGTGSTDRNPLHTYTAASFRKVTLTVTNSSGFKRTTKTLTVMPESTGATFVFNPSTPGPGQTVQFADTTAGDPTSWQWDFGDGSTSTVKNPSHAFVRAGSYGVSLIARTKSGSKQGSQTITVASVSVLSSSFTFSPSSPIANQSVQFTDTSTGSPTSWLWNFGDGTTSNIQNPIHTYTTAGSRTVTLTVSNGSSSNTTTRSLSIVSALTAAFNYSPISPAAGQVVQFTDISTGSPTLWQWNFGDGTTSVVQNPRHTFVSTGSYTVTLTIENGSGQNSTSRTITVSAAGSLAASFTYSPASPTAGQAVQFTDTSVGSPTAWQWNFADGATSVIQNPNHTFVSAGSHIVTLTVVNGSGQDSTSHTVTVVPVNTPTASFTYSPASPVAGQPVQFTDTSTGVPSQWQWNFGDGATSPSQNPSHTFAMAGSYVVTLSVSNDYGTDIASRTIAAEDETDTGLDIAQIQRDIDAAPEGAVISIPEGTVVGSTTIAINNKGITVRGAGIGKTFIDGGGFVVNGREGHPFRITGMSFQNGAAVTIRGDCKEFRVDHCEFARVNDMGHGILIEGYTYGVIDNCSFRNNRVLIYEARSGDAPWKRPLSLGTANAVYVEDCTFWANLGPNAIDANGGGRYVFRHNTTTNQECEAHGLFNTGMRGTFSYEIYGNTFMTENNGKGNYAAVLVRGGTGVIFDNTVTNGAGDPFDIFGHMYDQRSCNFTSGWGPYDGTSPTDQNTPGMRGYAGRDQIGRSTDYSATVVHPQAYEPLYVWNNTLDGRPAELLSRGCELSQEHIQLGRDFINGPRPGYTPYTYPHPLRND